VLLLAAANIAISYDISKILSRKHVNKPLALR